MQHLPKLKQLFVPGATRTFPPLTRPLVPVYRVGEKLRKGRSNWPEVGHFIVSPCGHELTVFRSDINADLIHAVRCGSCEFALLVEFPVIVLAYRFGPFSSWNDIPFCWHLQPEEWRVVPSVALSPQERAFLWITLVGSKDGIIHAQRGVTLSPSFTRSLHSAIRDQARSAFHPEECTAALSKVFLRYPTPVDRLALAIARTQGNE